MGEQLQGLEEFCRRQFGSAAVEDLQILSGGASMESYAFSCSGIQMVMRRLPVSDGGEADPTFCVGTLPLSLQADLIELCQKRQVSVPRILARLTPEDNLGVGFVMEKMAGEALPQKLLKEPKYSNALKSLTEQATRALASIHQVPIDALPNSLPYYSSKQLVENQLNIYNLVGARIPVFEFAFSWLMLNAPQTQDDSLVHGDFRLGNLLITEEGLSAVLDWELSHRGDRLRDVAYFCTPSWRFGRHHLEAGGYDSQENWIAAYEKASGQPVVRDDFQWWLIFNTLWWGVSCMQMGYAYRDGSVATLERTIIGRRVSEVEIDLLLQFENMRTEQSPSLHWHGDKLNPPEGEMSYGEIVTAIADWNRDKVQPDLQHHDLFESRIVGNGLGIIERQISWGSEFEHSKSRRLKSIGLTTKEVCDLLQDGKTLLHDDAIWDHLRLTALERVAIDQPKYAGFKIAKDRWVSA